MRRSRISRMRQGRRPDPIGARPPSFPPSTARRKKRGGSTWRRRRARCSITSHALGLWARALGFVRSRPMSPIHATWLSRISSRAFPAMPPAHRLRLLELPAAGRGRLDGCGDAQGAGAPGGASGAAEAATREPFKPAIHHATRCRSMPRDGSPRDLGHEQLATALRTSRPCRPGELPGARCHLRDPGRRERMRTCRGRRSRSRQPAAAARREARWNIPISALARSMAVRRWSTHWICAFAVRKDGPRRPAWPATCSFSAARRNTQGAHTLPAWDPDPTAWDRLHALIEARLRRDRSSNQQRLTDWRHSGIQRGLRRPHAEPTSARTARPARRPRRQGPDRRSPRLGATQRSCSRSPASV